MTRRDWEIRHSGTYVSLRDGDVNRPVLIQSVEDSNVFTVDVLRGEMPQLSWERESIPHEELSLHFPRIGYINSPSGFSFILTRTPSRQYRWSMCSGNASLIDPFEKEREVMEFPLITDLRNKYILYSIFNNKFEPIREALRLVRTQQRFSCAFNEKWAIGTSSVNNQICLYRREVPVGYFDDDKFNLAEGLNFLNEELEMIGIPQ